MKPPERNPVSAPPPDSRPVVAALRGVSVLFDYSQTPALNLASFEVRQGEVFGLVGPAGSGKTLVLKIVAGRLRPTDGKASVFGRSPRRAGIKARIGYLSGRAAGEPQLSWARRLFPGRFLNRRAASPERDSQRRSDLMQAILGNRDLIVLDEPFWGLAAAERREVTDLIRALGSCGKTVILSSDSLWEAKDICDRLAVLYRGEIQAVGTLDALLATPEAIRFLGPVLPRAAAERVLRVLREEAGGGAVLAQEAAAMAGQAVPDPAPAAARRSDQVLTPLTMTATPAPPERPDEPAADPVDHKKLEDLTKTGKSS